jgi:hypothetical protein
MSSITFTPLTEFQVFNTSFGALGASKTPEKKLGIINPDGKIIPLDELEKQVEALTTLVKGSSKTVTEQTDVIDKINEAFNLTRESQENMAIKLLGELADRHSDFQGATATVEDFEALFGIKVPAFINSTEIDAFIDSLKNDSNALFATLDQYGATDPGTITCSSNHIFELKTLLHNKGVSATPPSVSDPAQVVDSIIRLLECKDNPYEAIGLNAVVPLSGGKQVNLLSPTEVAALTDIEKGLYIQPLIDKAVAKCDEKLIQFEKIMTQGIEPFASNLKLQNISNRLTTSPGSPSYSLNKIKLRLKTNNLTKVADAYQQAQKDKEAIVSYDEVIALTNHIDPEKKDPYQLLKVTRPSDLSLMTEREQKQLDEEIKASYESMVGQLKYARGMNSSHVPTDGRILAMAPQIDEDLAAVKQAYKQIQSHPSRVSYHQIEANVSARLNNIEESLDGNLFKCFNVRAIGFNPSQLNVSKQKLIDEIENFYKLQSTGTGPVPALTPHMSERCKQLVAKVESKAAILADSKTRKEYQKGTKESGARDSSQSSNSSSSMTWTGGDWLKGGLMGIPLGLFAPFLAPTFAMTGPFMVVGFGAGFLLRWGWKKFRSNNS